MRLPLRDAEFVARSLLKLLRVAPSFPAMSMMRARTSTHCREPAL